jgi:transposase
MDGSIELSAMDRKTLLTAYRGPGEARTARRAHVLLLLADGHTDREIMELLFCSAGFISGVVKHFREGGVASILPESNGESAARPVWATRVIDWLCEWTPQDFGYFHSRWSCATLAEVLAWKTGHRVCAETVRRVLQKTDYVWHRPRPVAVKLDRVASLRPPLSLATKL